MMTCAGIHLPLVPSNHVRLDVFVCTRLSEAADKLVHVVMDERFVCQECLVAKCVGNYATHCCQNSPVISA